LAGRDRHRDPSVARREARRGRAALSAAVLLCAPLAAAAPAPGEAPPDPDLDAAGTRAAGPFRVRSSLAFRDIGYDDNVRFEARSRESDLTATLAPALKALLLARDRGGLILSQDAGYVLFRDHPELNHWNASLRARGILLLRRAALSLERRLESLQERPNDEIDERVRREDGTTIAGVRTLGAARFGAAAHLRAGRVEYASTAASGGAIGRALNRDHAAASVSGEARLMPRTTFVIEGIVGGVEFDAHDADRDARSVTILPGVRLDPSATLQGELKVGRIRLDALRRPRSGFRGTVGEGRLSLKAGGSGRITASGSRSLPFSTLDENLYYVATSWAGSYEQFFSRRLSVEAGLGRGLNRYPERIDRAGPRPFHGLRDDRLRSYAHTLRYRAGPRLGFTAGAQRFVRDSNDDAMDRDRNFYALGSTLAL
jgi:hypothetical protein